MLAFFSLALKAFEHQQLRILFNWFFSKHEQSSHYMGWFDDRDEIEARFYFLFVVFLYWLCFAFYSVSCSKKLS